MIPLLFAWIFLLIALLFVAVVKTMNLSQKLSEVELFSGNLRCRFTREAHLANTYRNALTFYASPDNWQPKKPINSPVYVASEIAKDQGDKAQKALEDATKIFYDPA